MVGFNRMGLRPQGYANHARKTGWLLLTPQAVSIIVPDKDATANQSISHNTIFCPNAIANFLYQNHSQRVRACVRAAPLTYLSSLV